MGVVWNVSYVVHKVVGGGVEGLEIPGGLAPGLLRFARAKQFERVTLSRQGAIAILVDTS